MPNEGGALVEAAKRAVVSAPWFVVARSLPAIGRAWTSLFWVLVVVGGLLPLALSISMAWLVERVDVVDAAGAASLTPALIAVGATFLLAQSHGAWIEATGFVLGQRLKQAIGLEVMRIAMAPAGIAHLEDPSVADSLDRSRELGYGWSINEAVYALGVVLSMRARAIGGAVALLVLSPVALMLGAAGWWGVNRYRAETQRLFLKRAEAQTQGLRRAKYLRRLVVGGDAAKESRVFGFGPFLVARHRDAWFGGMDEIWADRRRLDVQAFPAIALFLGGLGGALWILGDAGFDGRISLGAVIVALQALTAIQGFGPVGDESWQLIIGAKVLANSKEAERISNHASATLVGASTDVPSPRDAIRLENVRFAYPGTQAAILDGFDLEIPAGRSLAIVGANGAGKTTLIKLLCRLYDPDGGRITVDATDIRELHPDAWRRSVGVIFQDFVRFELSARDNIALGAPHLDDAAALERAARLAGALPAIERNGWEATLSRGYSDGAELSGGEWQRVALARALYAIAGGARILILDEPTANLDVRAEARLYERFLELTHGVTTILISHRFSTVRLAERIAVLDHGRLTEIGSHEQLLALGGTYAEMFTAQASAYHDTLEDDDASLEDDEVPA